MENWNMIYEGKAKKVFRTDDPKLYIVDYKDDATAFTEKEGNDSRKGRSEQYDVCHHL
jgi:phosphoribosylaminoimidazole-succinocarboxamide synthase